MSDLTDRLRADIGERLAGTLASTITLSPRELGWCADAVLDLIDHDAAAQARAVKACCWPWDGSTGEDVTAAGVSDAVARILAGEVSGE